MIQTRGIVLSTMKYRETSLIVRIFTEFLGLQSYLVQGVRAKNARYKAGLFQPLTVLDMVVRHLPHLGLQRLVEVTPHTSTYQILWEVHKGAIALFIAEVTGKVLREGEKQTHLFVYIFEYIEHLTTLSEGYTTFILRFLLGLANHLGFGLAHAAELAHQLQAYTKHPPVDQEEIYILEALLKDSQEVPMTREQQKRLLAHLLQFYALHMESMHTLKSIKVLQQLRG